MAKGSYVRRATRGRRGDLAEVARWLGVFWFCRCRYSNVASYRCYYCGKRAPSGIRSLVAETLRAADQVDVQATEQVPAAARQP